MLLKRCTYTFDIYNNNWRADVLRSVRSVCSAVYSILCPLSVATRRRTIRCGADKPQLPGYPYVMPDVDLLADSLSNDTNFVKALIIAATALVNKMMLVLSLP